jgi:hypothetical protein
VTIHVSLHGATRTRASAFLSDGKDHSSVYFMANGQTIQLFFTGAEVWKAQALADAFNAPAPVQS